jgi:4a-hydroxytetrahydrobiopterin dehydratase
MTEPAPLITVPDAPAEPLSLPERRCVPCRGGVPPLSPDERTALMIELDAIGRGWRLVGDGHHLERAYDFPDFVSALAFTNAVGAVAEEADHHPDIQLRWGRVVLSVFTHKIDGLTESDFILAARIEELERPGR